MLKRLTLCNFKSIASAAIDLDRFNLLVGRNGSGKSNIADALSFLGEVNSWPLQTVFNRRGGPINVLHRSPNLGTSFLDFGIGVYFEGLRSWSPSFSREDLSARYAFQLSVGRTGFQVVREQCVVTAANGKKEWFERRGPTTQSSVEFLNNLSFHFIAPDSLALPFIGGISSFISVSQAMKSMAVYSIDPSKLREFQDPDAGKRLLSDGSNAASVLASLKSDSVRSRRLFEILSSVVPELDRVRPQTIGRKQHLRFWQRWPERGRVSFDAFNMSDGTLRAFGILLALFQSDRPSLLLIEEPETSLHPAATAAIVETLRQESKNTQIIISTHSPEVLDLAEASEDNFRIVSWNAGRTTIGSVEGTAKTSLQKHLASPGELFRMMILDAPQLFEEIRDERQQELFEDLGEDPANS